MRMNAPFCLPSGLQRFDLAVIPPEPWRNGAATHVGTRLRWRISAADIIEPGVFSVFDGVDRTAVLMRGAGLTLQGPDECWVFEGIGAVARFPGELPVHASPGPTGAARLWNVMVDRATLRAEVAVHRGHRGTLARLTSGVLVVLDGTLKVSLPGVPDAPLLSLRPEEGLWLSDLSQPLALQAEHGPAQWVVTTFQPR